MSLAWDFSKVFVLAYVLALWLGPAPSTRGRIVLLACCVAAVVAIDRRIHR
jgi:hypothetical protein